MSEKKTYYDILGLADTAATEAVEQAFLLHQRILETATDIEDRHNRLAFIQHARDVLFDPQKRAHYDLQLRQQTKLVIEDGPVQSSSRIRRLALLIMIGGTVWIWQHYHTKPAQITTEVHVTPARESDSGGETQFAGDSRPQEASPTPSAMTDADVVHTAPSQKPSPERSYIINTGGPNAELIKKLVWSVYGIVGPKGFGTGIMVDNEGLLTNCHVLAANMPLNGKKIYAINAVTRDHAEITDVAYLDNQDACLVHAPGLAGQAIEVGSTTWMAAGVKTHNIGYANGRLTTSPGEFLYWINKYGQNFLVTNNFCDHGVSGGPLVDDDGRLVGLTTGGNNDRSRCGSLTVETVRSLRFQSTIPIQDFPADYVSNIVRRAW